MPLGRARAEPRFLTTPHIGEAQRVRLAGYVAAVPGEDSEYDQDVWLKVVERGDRFIALSGCMYRAAHAYVAHWRATRAPATLTPDGISISNGRVGPKLIDYAMGVGN